MDDRTTAELMIRATGAITAYDANDYRVGTILYLEATQQYYVDQCTGTNGAKQWKFLASSSTAATSTRRTVAAATSVADTTPAIAGQFRFDPATMLQPGTTLVLDALLSVSAGTITLKLLNLDTTTYVDIGGVGVPTLTATSALPSEVTSVNLASGTVTGFSTTVAHNYQVEIFTDDPTHLGLLGIAELVTTVV